MYVCVCVCVCVWHMKNVVLSFLYNMKYSTLSQNVHTHPIASLIYSPIALF